MVRRSAQHKWWWVAAGAAVGAFVVAAVPAPYRAYVAHRSMAFTDTPASSVLALVNTSDAAAATAAAIHVSPSEAAAAMTVRAHGPELAIAFRSSTRDRARRALDALDDATIGAATHAAQKQFETAGRAFFAAKVSERAARATLAEADRRTSDADVRELARAASRARGQLEAQRALAVAAHDAVLAGQLDDRIAANQQEMFDLNDLAVQHTSLSLAVTAATTRSHDALARYRDAEATRNATLSYRYDTDSLDGDGLRAASPVVGLGVALFVALMLVALANATGLTQELRRRFRPASVRVVPRPTGRQPVISAFETREHHEVVDIVAATAVEHATAGHES